MLDPDPYGIYEYPGLRIRNTDSSLMDQKKTVSPAKTPAMNWWKHLDPEEGDSFNNSNSGSSNNATPVKEETKEIKKVQVEPL